MNILDIWPYKWFGIWREYGPVYQNCPSIYDFVIPEVATHYDKSRLRKYITTAQVVASASRSHFPCPFTGTRAAGTSISYRTDGEWLWLDDLADYIDDYNVAIPSAWLHHIEKNGYIPPAVDMEAIGRLEQPPIIV